jgi:hypothetical protein
LVPRPLARAAADEQAGPIRKGDKSDKGYRNGAAFCRFCRFWDSERGLKPYASTAGL